MEEIEMREMYRMIREESPNLDPIFVVQEIADEIEYRAKKKVRDHLRNTTYANSVNKYFVTLTASASAKEYVSGIHSILNQKRLQITYGYGCIELTKDGNPHAHIYLECKRYCSKSDFTRTWKRTFLDVKNVKKDNGIRKYQDKDADNDALKAYLDAVGVQRVYTLDDVLLK